ncbi:MAG TPA: DUF1622 domain-containing protein [Jatrophihabitans sp.]|nr:DUF1622 domain-containing protein [Jatrophihabitans sp.]
MSFETAMEHVAQGFELLGVSVLVVGAAWSAVLTVVVWRRTADGRRAYRTLRESFGGVLLLGLEVLVAADLIRTTAVPPTLTGVAALGLIVLIRTFLSFSLEVEISGRLPWQRALAPNGPRRIQAAARNAGGTTDRR